MQLELEIKPCINSSTIPTNGIARQKDALRNSARNGNWCIGDSHLYLSFDFVVQWCYAFAQQLLSQKIFVVFLFFFLFHVDVFHTQCMNSGCL